MATKFDEYKLFVENLARFSDRRHRTSSLFVTVNSLLLSAIGLILRIVDDGSWTQVFLPIPLMVAGMAVSIWWKQILVRYRKLIGLHIRVLRQMESEMPGSVRMFHQEDRLYPRNSAGEIIPGKGMNFADMEARLPLLFLILFALFALWMALIWFGPYVATVWGA